MRKGAVNLDCALLEAVFDAAPKVRGVKRHTRTRTAEGVSDAHILLDNIVRSDTKGVATVDERQLKLF